MFETAISDEVAGLIGNFSAIPALRNGFYMAGGTALALHLGHRRSVDIDLFSAAEFDPSAYAEILLDRSSLTKIIDVEKNTLHCFVDGVKVSLFHYSPKLISPTTDFKGFAVAGIPDIACMKLIALSQRGEKKDFYDVYEIMKKHSAAELKNFLLEKYGASRINCYHVLKSFFYFDDAEKNVDPISLNGSSWNDVKQFFRDSEKTMFKDMMPCYEEQNKSRMT